LAEVSVDLKAVWWAALMVVSLAAAMDAYSAAWMADLKVDESVASKAQWSTVSHWAGTKAARSVAFSAAVKVVPMAVSMADHLVDQTVYYTPSPQPPPVFHESTHTVVYQRRTRR
jgi:hypothetical protein